MGYGGPRPAVCGVYVYVHTEAEEAERRYPNAEAEGNGNAIYCNWKIANVLTLLLFSDACISFAIKNLFENPELLMPFDPIIIEILFRYVQLIFLPLKILKI